MNRPTLVEWLERWAAELSPAARELYEELELIIESSRPGDDVGPLLQENAHKIRSLPSKDQALMEMVFTLRIGLSTADARGGDIKDALAESIITTAQIKDRAAGRSVDPNMTVHEALARLAEEY